MFNATSKEIERLNVLLDNKEEDLSNAERKVKNLIEQNISLEEGLARNNLEKIQKEAEIRSETADEIDKARRENTDLRIKVAQLTEKVAMLEKVVDISSEIIDVKDLIGSLIKKLPEVNLKSLSVNVPCKK
jgi:hypothetical protein